MYAQCLIPFSRQFWAKGSGVSRRRQNEPVGCDEKFGDGGGAGRGVFRRGETGIAIGVCARQRDGGVAVCEAVSADAPFQAHAKEVHQVALSADGKRLVSASQHIDIGAWDK